MVQTVAFGLMFTFVTISIEEIPPTLNIYETGNLLSYMPFINFEPKYLS